MKRKEAARQKAPEYLADLTRSAAKNDPKDCSVRAVSQLSGVDYDTVYDLFAKLGRKHQRGVTLYQIIEALDILGFKADIQNPQDIIDTFPGKHKFTKKYITSHTADRWPQCWPSGKYLMHTARHVIAFVDGRNLDWSRGRSLRCKNLYKIERK